MKESINTITITLGIKSAGGFWLLFTTPFVALLLLQPMNFFKAFDF